MQGRMCAAAAGEHRTCDAGHSALPSPPRSTPPHPTHPTHALTQAALLADDGQLALSRLAGTTVSTLMPKIETQGQVGRRRVPGGGGGGTQSQHPAAWIAVCEGLLCT